MADSIRAYFASQYHTALASWALATKDHAPSGRMKWVQGPLDAVEFCVSESWTRFLPEWLHSQSYGQRNQRTYQAFFGAIEAYGYSRGDLAEMARDPASRRLINDLDCRAKNCYS
ncbi:MAG: hypothetical protein KDK78_06620 [Chlamydiia bacterium]|nr:hypothetical protein [Chlamydiia bacterium]